MVDYPGWVDKISDEKPQCHPVSTGGFGCSLYVGYESPQRFRSESFGCLWKNSHGFTE